MKPEYKYPALYALAQELRREFGGRIYGNRGFPFTVENKSRTPQIEIGIGPRTVLIIIEGLLGYDIAFSTSRKHRWRYRWVHRDEQRKRTFYLRKPINQERLEKLFAQLSPGMEQLLLSETNWFSYEPDSWFVELPISSRPNISRVIEMLERERFQPDSAPKGGPAASVDNLNTPGGPPSVS